MPIPNLDQIISSGVFIGSNKQEAAVGIAWLKEHGHEWDRVEFNVHLGPGITLPGSTPGYVQKSATASTQLRADMVLFRDHSAAIVECKGRITASALGQLTAYGHLLKGDNPTLLHIYLYVAGQSIVPGLEPVYDRAGIIVELFPLAIPS